MQNNHISIREDQPTVGRYVDLLNDVAFKIIFGKPENKDLLIALLSVVIPELKIKDIVSYLDKEKQGSDLDDKKSVFDVLCETSDGEEILIEVQIKPQGYFRDRTLYYSFQELLWQHGKGDDDYSLKPIYVVSFLKFVMAHDKPDDEKFVWKYRLLEPQTGELMTDALNFTFVEMPKFKKQVDELANDEDDFYFCLLNMRSLKQLPERLAKNPVLKKLSAEAEYINMPKDQKRKYIAKMTTERDIKNQIAYGREEGRAEGILQTARAMKANGITPDVIAKCTGLSAAEIAGL